MNNTLDLFHPPAEPLSRESWRTEPLAAALAWLHSVQVKGRPYSAATIQKQLSIVRRYIASLHRADTDLLRARPEEIARFLEGLDHLERETTLTLTRHRYLRTIVRLHGAVQQAGARPDNPARALLVQFPAPLTRPLPETLAPREEARVIDRLVSAATTPQTPWRTVRDAAIAAAAIGSGLQPRELIALTLADVFLDEAPPFLTVAAHGRRPERVVPVSPALRPVLAAWLTLRRARGGALDGAVFCSGADAQPLTVRTVHRACEHWMGTANIERTHAGARLLRGTFATRQLRAGKPVPVLRDWLGLAQDGSAAVYARAIVNPGGVEVA